MTNERGTKRTRWITYEPFTFTDGVRHAWVAWEMCFTNGWPSEPRCIGVSEVSHEDAESVAASVIN